MVSFCNCHDERPTATSKCNGPSLSIYVAHQASVLSRRLRAASTQHSKPIHRAKHEAAVHATAAMFIERRPLMPADDDDIVMCIIAVSLHAPPAGGRHLGRHETLGWWGLSSPLPRRAHSQCHTGLPIDCCTTGANNMLHVSLPRRAVNLHKSGSAFISMRRSWSTKTGSVLFLCLQELISTRAPSVTTGMPNATQ